MIVNYEHLHCDKCGGIIGSYDRGDTYTCEQCKKEFDIYRLEYKYLMINDKTGWVFPMKEKGEF